MPDDSKPKKEDTTPKAKTGTTDNPLIFISHDSRDGDLAEAFANLLQDASGGILKSFRSSDKKGTAGIEFGAEWYRTIMDRLDNATDVVALLTARSLNRPWILYETGVAKGKLDTTVLGLALGVPLNKVSTGPFAQFQNSDDDQDSITKLVLQLIRRHPQAAPREEAVKRQVQAFLDDIKELLKDRTGKDTEGDAQRVGASDESPVAKLFEEVKVLVRGMPERVAQELDGGRGSRKMRMRHFSPRMLGEFARMSSDGDNAIGMLMVLSYVRDDFPWIYDLGLEHYRATLTGDPDSAEMSYRRLRHAFEMIFHGPIEIMIDSPQAHESMIILRQIMEDHDDLFFQLGKRGRRRPTSKPSSSDD